MMPMSSKSASFIYQYLRSGSPLHENTLCVYLNATLFTITREWSNLNLDQNRTMDTQFHMLCAKCSFASKNLVGLELLHESPVFDPFQGRYGRKLYLQFYDSNCPRTAKFLAFNWYEIQRFTCYCLLNSWCANRQEI